MKVPPTIHFALLLFSLPLFAFDEEAALLAAIHAHPEEDTPRLVYADWLDERGGDANTMRAEFIRIQIKMARMSAGWQRDSLQIDADRILRWNEEKWLPSLSRDLRGKHWEGQDSILEWERGFPKKLSIPYRALEDAKAIEALNQLPSLPTIEVVTFANGAVEHWENYDRYLRTQMPGLEKLSLLERAGAIRLVLGGNHSPKPEYLTEMLWALRKPRNLTVQPGNYLDRKHIGELERHLPDLESLSFGERPDRWRLFTDEAVEQLLRSQAFSRLRTLSVGLSNGRSLTQIRGFPALTELDLRGSLRLDDAGFAEFVRSPLVRQLEVLSLPKPEYKDEYHHALSQLHLAADHLVSLEFDGVPVSEAQFPLLAAKIKANREARQNAACLPLVQQLGDAH